MAQEQRLPASNAHAEELETIWIPDELIAPPPSELWRLSETKFVGYFQWTVFAVLLAPIAFWVFGLK